jgi:hypothetical protein
MKAISLKIQFCMSSHLSNFLIFLQPESIGNRLNQIFFYYFLSIFFSFLLNRRDVDFVAEGHVTTYVVLLYSLSLKKRPDVFIFYILNFNILYFNNLLVKCIELSI